MTPLFITVVALVLFSVLIAGTLAFIDIDEMNAVSRGPSSANTLVNLVQASASFADARGYNPSSVAELGSEFSDIDSSGVGAQLFISDGFACLGVPNTQSGNRQLDAASVRLSGAIVSDNCGSTSGSMKYLVYKLPELDESGSPAYIPPTASSGGGPVTSPPPPPAPGCADNTVWTSGYREPGYSCRTYTNAGMAADSFATTISVLNMGEQAFSPNGAYVLRMQYDGNLVLYNVAGQRSIWNINKYGFNHFFIFQPDGNGVVYNQSNAVIWAYDRFSSGGRFVIQNDGNLVAYRSNGSAFWDSGTYER